MAMFGIVGLIADLFDQRRWRLLFIQDNVAPGYLQGGGRTATQQLDPVLKFLGDLDNIHYLSGDE